MSLERESDPLRRIPTKHTTALRADIGPILRDARLKRGQSLDAVAQQTRISKRFLEALEESRFEQFPAVVYLRGFLKGYCEYLDVNFDEIWATLNASSEAAPQASPATAGEASAAGINTTNDTSAHPKPHEPAPKSEAHAPKAAHAPAPAPAHAPHAAPALHDAHAPAAHAGGGATGAIALSVALAIGLAVYLMQDRTKGPQTPVAVAPAALQPMPRAVEPKLFIRLKSDAWLRVSVDGQVVFEGRAPRDAVQEWKPVKFVDLRTTELAALDLNLSGQQITLGAPGPDGQYRVEIP